MLQLAMAEARPYEPTQRRLAEARRRGQVALSRDVIRAAVLLAALAALWLTGEAMVQALKQCFAIALAAVRDGSEPAEALKRCALLAVTAMVPLLVAVLLAALAAGFVQVGPLFAAQAVTPRFSAVDPVRGLRGLFSRWRAIDLLLAGLKLAAVAAVALYTLRQGMRGLVGLVERDALRTLALAGELVFVMCIRVAGAMAAIAVVDFFYQRYQYRQQLRMTRSEWEREQRETEGDPRVRRQRRRLHLQALAAAELEAAREADLLVTGTAGNATAVALRRVVRDGVEEAPRVAGVGYGELAWRMVRTAAAESVAMARDEALAAELGRVQPGGEIPQRLYQAVADLLTEVRGDGAGGAGAGGEGAGGEGAGGEGAGGEGAGARKGSDSGRDGR